MSCSVDRRHDTQILGCQQQQTTTTTTTTKPYTARPINPAILSSTLFLRLPLHFLAPFVYGLDEISNIHRHLIYLS